MKIDICDVGPRDGLQNESTVLPPEIRGELVEKLIEAGLQRIEAASFVSPRLVPAMAGAGEVLASVAAEGNGVAINALVLNEQGYDAALAAGAGMIRFGFAATDEFGLRNQNQTSAQGLATGKRLIERARKDGVGVAVAISVAFGCPFSGPVAPERVLALVEELMGNPPDEVSLADTIGVAVPTQVAHLVQESRQVGAAVNAHFHNTRNTGYANAVAAFDAGVTSFDSSIGGIGGCPFAPRATGNIATEDLVYLFERMGVDTGIDLDALIRASKWLGHRLGREVPALLPRAGVAMYSGAPDPV